MVDDVDHEQRVAARLMPEDRCQRTIQPAAGEALSQVRANTGFVERRERELGTLTA